MMSPATDSAVFESDQVLWPDRSVTPGRITVTGERITAVEHLSGGRIPRSEVPGVVTLEGLVAPGFVDTHVHGGGGGDFASSDPASILRARDFHRAHGTTSVIASLATDRIEVVLDQLALLAALCHAGELDGVHLETPFLSTRQCGAHPPGLLRHPDPETIEKLITVGGTALSMVTLAPELPGSLDAIDRFVAAGVRVALGHTVSGADQTRAALDHGATIATHLFNAMNPIHHRDSGPIPVLLTDERVTIELICDGVHVAPEVITMAIAAAGTDRTMLITDAMVAAGLPDGAYDAGVLQTQVADGQARILNPDGTLGSIAGSTIDLASAVRHLTGQTRVSVPDALHMAAAVPATAHGLSDVGRIKVGARANLVVLDQNLMASHVLSDGAWVDIRPVSPAERSHRDATP